MIEVQVFHNKTYVVAEDPGDIAYIAAALKIVFFKGSGKNRKYDKTVNLWNSKEKSFPTGYLETLAAKVDKYGVEITFEDMRDCTITNTINLPNRPFENLRENQEECRKAIRTSPVGFASSATATGKSMYIDMAIEDKKVLTLIAVPTEALREQIYSNLCQFYGTLNVSKSLKDHDNSLKQKNKLAALKERKRTYKQINCDYIEERPEDLYLETKGYEKIGDKHVKVRKADSVVQKKTWPKILVICNASIPDLPMDYVKEVEMFVSDEGHKFSEVVRQFLLEAESCMYRYSISATNWRERKEDMHTLVSGFGNNIIYEELPKDSIEKGRIKKLNHKIRNPPTPHDFFRDLKNPDDIIKKCIVGNYNRNDMIISDAMDMLANGRTVLICVSESAHCEVLKILFKEKGIDSREHYSKLGAAEKRENIIASQIQKSNMVMISTEALGIGVDTKGFNAIILADVRKNSNKIFQFIGRAARLEDGVEDMLVYSYHDWFNKTTQKWSYEVEKKIKDYYNGDESFTEKYAKKAGIKMRSTFNRSTF